VQELGGSTARQIAKLANRNIPYHRHHAQFTKAGWPGDRDLLFCVGLNALLSESSNFSSSSGLFGGFAKFTKSSMSGFHDRFMGTDCE